MSPVTQNDLEPFFEIWCTWKKYFMTGFSNLNNSFFPACLFYWCLSSWNGNCLQYNLDKNEKCYKVTRHCYLAREYTSKWDIFPLDGMQILNGWILPFLEHHSIFIPLNNLTHSMVLLPILHVWTVDNIRLFLSFFTISPRQLSCSR